MELPSQLREADRLAVLAVGSQLRGDDGAGCHAALQLEALRRKHRVRRLRVFAGGTAPENLTGEVARFLRGGHASRPHVVLVDAADMGLRPGAVRVVRPKQVEGATLSTHQLPLSVLAGYLAATVPCTVSILAIQPGNVRFGAPLSAAAAAAAHKVAEALWDAFRLRQVRRPASRLPGPDAQGAAAGGTASRSPGRGPGTERDL